MNIWKEGQNETKKSPWFICLYNLAQDKITQNEEVSQHWLHDD
jgi:hypothetical protein